MVDTRTFGNSISINDAVHEIRDIVNDIKKTVEAHGIYKKIESCPALQEYFYSCDGSTSNSCMTWKAFLKCSENKDCDLDDETVAEVLIPCFVTSYKCSDDNNASFWCGFNKKQKTLLVAVALIAADVYLKKEEAFAQNNQIDT